MALIQAVSVCECVCILGFVFFFWWGGYEDSVTYSLGISEEH